MSITQIFYCILSWIVEGYHFKSIFQFVILKKIESFVYSTDLYVALMLPHAYVCWNLIYGHKWGRLHESSIPKCQTFFSHITNGTRSNVTTHFPIRLCWRFHMQYSFHTMLRKISEFSFIVRQTTIGLYITTSIGSYIVPMMVTISRIAGSTYVDAIIHLLHPITKSKTNSPQKV